MTLNNTVWEYVTAVMTTGTPVSHQVAAYLHRTGWNRQPAGGWETTVNGARAWLPDIPADPEAGVPPLPAGAVNGLVQRQIAQLLIERDTTMVEILLRLEVLENRSWTQVWSDITGPPARVPTPAPPTLLEQAAQITFELADLNAYSGVDGNTTGHWWPWVALDLGDTDVITAFPTHPRDVPTAMAPGDCWSIDLQLAPTLAAMTRAHRAALTPTTFTATALRALTGTQHRTTNPGYTDTPPRDSQR
ncbi:hypothetical protein ACQP2U_42515 (plasmid) [Nocardia sp. CA-084685]|uniref:hypothetical protein n=1 Tax=Nocardia sp. CA-084685 TaxID=3239970 RepID=UPI003D95B017